MYAIEAGIIRFSKYTYYVPWKCGTHGSLGILKSSVTRMGLIILKYSIAVMMLLSSGPIDATIKEQKIGPVCFFIINGF